MYLATCLNSILWPVFSTVVNGSFAVSVGELAVVPENIRVSIDCGLLIDQSAIDGEIASITWFKYGRPILNGTEVHVVLASDNRTITITDTLIGTPARVGTEGNYSCEVCLVGDQNCTMNKTFLDVCSKYY